MATILRSSKYVRNFAECFNKIGFSHIKVDSRVDILFQRHSAPSTFARSLATQVAAKKLDNESNLEITLRKLDADVKRYGRISRAKLQRILDAFDKSKSVTSTQALMVIRCCGNLVSDELPESRSELVNQVWKSLENLGIQLDLSHYNALLRVYVENEYAFSPTEVLAELECKGIEPNKLTYQRLINRYCQQGDIEGASKILEFMREKGISVNENIFTALVRGHSEANDMVSAADILSVMRQAGLEPSPDTYKELLCGYAKHGDIQSITSTLSECDSKGVHLLDTDFLDIIYSLACNGHAEHIEKIFSLLPKEVGYLQDALNHVLKLVHAGHVDVAMQVLASIPNRDKGQTGSSVIKQLAKANLPVLTLLDFCKQIQSKGINSRALLIALESNLIEGNIEGSMLFLKSLQESGTEIRDHYFWPIFVALGRSKDNSGIDHLLRTMKTEFSQPISGETLRDYVIPNKTGEYDKILAELLLVGIPAGSIANAIVHNMIFQMKIKEAADFAPQYVFRYNATMFCRPLTTALDHTKDVESFITILRHIYQNRFNAKTIRNEEVAVDNKILEPYIIDVATFIKEENSETLAKVLENLLTNGYNISDNCVSTLQRIVGKRMTPDLSRLFNKFKSKVAGNFPLSSMDISSLRAEISRLEGSTDRFNSNDEVSIATKKRLLYLYSRLKDVPNLEKTVAELNEQGFEFTETMHRQILDAYINSDILDKSEEYLAILRQQDPSFILEDSRLIKYIVLLVKNDRIDDAVKFLQDQQSVQIIDKDGNKNIWWRLLNAVADTGSATAVNAIFEMLIQKEYIEISGPNLGPLIKVHIVRGDLTEALSVFEKICETYNHTPLKNELAKKLIQAEDANALQRLTDLSTQVHGESNSLYELAQSFIECDCLRQAKKILQIPALHSKSRRLLIGANRYKEQGMTIYLERVISVIKDIPHFKTMPEFYEDLLHCYDKENNWEKGLNLQKEMEEDEIEPSDIFLATLANLLNRNNQRVTFTVKESLRGRNISQHRDNQVSKPARYSSAGQQSLGGYEEGSENNNSTRRGINRAKEETTLIESLIQKGQLHTAFEITENLVARNTYPTTRTFRFLIRRAGLAGEIESLEKLGEKLPQAVKMSVNYENCLCQAYIVARKTDEYLNKLEKQLEEIIQSGLSETGLSEFPMVGVRNMVEENPDITEKLTRMAEKFASKGYLYPINSLWIHYFLKGKEQEADKIWSEYLVKSRTVIFNSITRFAEKNNDPEILRKLIKTLQTSSQIDDNAKGQVYSTLIKLSYLNDKTQESIDILREALSTLSINNLRENTIVQLKSYLETKGLSLPTEFFPESQVTEAKEQLTA